MLKDFLQIHMMNEQVVEMQVEGTGIYSITAEKV